MTRETKYQLPKHKNLTGRRRRRRRASHDKSSFFSKKKQNRRANKEKYVDANLDASDNAFSGNKSSSEMLTSQSQIPEIAKKGNAKQ